MKSGRKFSIGVIFFMFVLQISLIAGQKTIVFDATVDNLIMESSVDESTANTVYAHSTENSVGINHSYYQFYNYVQAASLIFFDLTALVGKTVNKAYLYLYVTGLAGDPYGAAQRTDYAVYAISQGWNSSTVTWNNQPNIFNTSLLFEVPLSSSAPTVIDVTTYVKQWMSGAWVNSGFKVMDAYQEAQLCNCLDATIFGSIEGPAGKSPQLFMEVIADDNPEKFLPPIINYLLN